MQRMSNDSRPSSAPATNANKSPVLPVRQEITTPRPTHAATFPSQDYMGQHHSPSMSDDDSDESEDYAVGRQSLLHVLGRTKSNSSGEDESDDGDNQFLPFTTDRPPRTVISGTTPARDTNTPPSGFNMQPVQQQTTPPVRLVQRLRPTPAGGSRGGTGTNNSSVNPSPPSTVSMGSSFSDLSGKSRLC